MSVCAVFSMLLFPGPWGRASLILVVFSMDWGQCEIVQK